MSTLERLLQLASRVDASANAELKAQADTALSTCCKALDDLLASSDSHPPTPVWAPPRYDEVARAAGAADDAVQADAIINDEADGTAHDADGTEYAAPAPNAEASAAEVEPVAAEVTPAAAEAEQHLLFLVHGIGRNDDFKDDDQQLSWDGTEGTDGVSHLFKRTLAQVLDAGMRHAPLGLSVRTIEWHSRVHEDGSAGSDALLDASAPDGVRDLRAFTKGHVIDVLHYTSAAHGQRVVNAVCEQVGARRHPSSSAKRVARATGASE
jgi:hypothetical protein